MGTQNGHYWVISGLAQCTSLNISVNFWGGVGTGRRSHIKEGKAVSNVKYRTSAFVKSKHLFYPVFLK